MAETIDKPIPVALERRFMDQAGRLDRVYESLLALKPIAMIDDSWIDDWVTWMAATNNLRDEIEPALAQGRSMVAGLDYIWWGAAAIGAWLTKMFLQQTSGATMNNKLAYAKELKNKGYTDEQSVDLANKLFGDSGISWWTIGLAVAVAAIFFRK